VGAAMQHELRNVSTRGNALAWAYFWWDVFAPRSVRPTRYFRQFSRTAYEHDVVGHTARQAPDLRDDLVLSYHARPRTFSSHEIKRHAGAVFPDKGIVLYVRNIADMHNEIIEHSRQGAVDAHEAPGIRPAGQQCCTQERRYQSGHVATSVWRRNVCRRNVSHRGGMALRHSTARRQTGISLVRFAAPPLAPARGKIDPRELRCGQPCSGTGQASFKIKRSSVLQPTLHATWTNRHPGYWFYLAFIAPDWNNRGFVTQVQGRGLAWQNTGKRSKRPLIRDCPGAQSTKSASILVRVSFVDGSQVFLSTALGIGLRELFEPLNITAQTQQLCIAIAQRRCANIPSNLSTHPSLLSFPLPQPI